MPLRNKSQEMARFALKAINQFRENLTEFKQYATEFKQYAKRLPSMILRNGLILTLAFYKSKCGTRQRIYKILCEWFKGKTGKDDLLEGLLNKDALTYRQVSKEALALATWLQRIADAEIEEAESGE